MKKLVLVLTLVSTPALAQNATLDRLAAQIGQLVIGNTNLSTENEALRAQIAELKKRITELEKSDAQQESKASPNDGRGSAQPEVR